MHPLKNTMATLSDIALAAAINILSAFAFFLIFAILRIQPINDRVYFPKWYLKGLRSSPIRSGALGGKFVNFDFRSYIKFLSWMYDALQMPEPELIDHAGLDSAVYLRIYLIGYALMNPFNSMNNFKCQIDELIPHLSTCKCRLKIFTPITFLAFSISIPVNWTNDTLKHTNLTYSDIDKLSISNIPIGSNRFG